MTPSDLAACRESLTRLDLLARLVAVPEAIARQREVDTNNLRIALNELDAPSAPEAGTEAAPAGEKTIGSPPPPAHDDAR